MAGHFYLDNGLFVRMWEDVSNAKGVIQIIHGMGEHSLRYDDTARYFNEIGYVVYADDHRGHGYSVDSCEKLGDIEGDFTLLVEDEKYMTDFISEQHPGLPVYVLGHSMGSFIAQGHMAEYGHLVNGYILSGSCGKREVETLVGWLLSGLLRIIYKNKKSPFLKKLMFLGYNGKIGKIVTPFDWLTRKKDVVKRYMDDSLCGFVYTSGFYASFLKFLNNLYRKRTFKFTKKDIPVLIISGEEDPVGLYGMGVRKLRRFYKNQFFTNLEMRIYSGARHEILNEINSIEVLRDVENWLEKQK